MNEASNTTNTNQALKDLWELHLASEFSHKSAEEALGTMTSDPRVTIVPTMIGGHGRDELHTLALPLDSLVPFDR